MCSWGFIWRIYLKSANAGLDFAITAMFIFLAIAQFESITAIKNLHSTHYCRHSNDVIAKYVYAFISSNINCSHNFSSVRSDGTMITHMNMLILILLCGIVTLLIRIIPFIMISKVQLPDVVVRWLSFIPITLFTALVIDSIIQQTPHGEGYTLNIPYIIALIPTVILSIITRSLTITIISGIVIMATLRFFF